MIPTMPNLTRRAWAIVGVILAACYTLDRLAPLQTGQVDQQWIALAIMAAMAIASAIKKKKEADAAAAAANSGSDLKEYELQRQNAIDQTKFDQQQAKAGERTKYANALIRAKGFALPAMDDSRSQGVKLNIPKVPSIARAQGGGVSDLILGGAAGLQAGQQVASGFKSEDDESSTPGGTVSQEDNTNPGNSYSQTTAGSNPYSDALRRNNMFGKS